MKQFLRSKANLLLLLVLPFSFQKNYAQSPTLQFANVLETAHDQGVWSRATVTDTEGNFYITGLFHGTVDFNPSAGGSFPLVYQGGTENDTDGESDVYLAKYNSAGGLIWAKQLLEPTFGGMNEERASSMVIDDNGNLFLTGFTNTRGFFVSKWNSDGDEIWTDYFDDVPDNFLTTFALRKNGGSILVSGIFADVMDFDPSPTESSELTAVNNDGFLLSLSEYGTFEWVKQFRCNGGVIITGLETDLSNNIFLSGIFLGTVDMDPDTTANAFITSQSVSTGAISSAFLAKYDSSGELLWNKHLRGTATTDFFMTFIKKDNAGSIILTGSYKGTATFLPTTTSLNTGTSYNSFLAKYSTDGALMWTNLFGIPTTTQTTFFASSFCANVIVDGCNNIYVSGEFQGNCDFDPGTGSSVLSTLNNTTSAFAASYSPDGDYLWAIDIGGLGNVTFVEFNGYLPIALDSNNDLIFTGTFRQQLDFDPTAGSTVLSSNSTNANIAGVFIAKYNNPANCLLNNPGFEESDFRIFPNPSGGIVNISAGDLTGSYTATVFDISGKKLLSRQMETQEAALDLSNLAKGIYIIEIHSGHKTTHQKLILD